MFLSRRKFLASIGASTAATTSLFGSGILMSSAHAAEVSGYKALVCVFFLGGVDNYDVLIPFDNESYERFSDIRGGLIDQYNGLGSSRRRSDLLPLSPMNAYRFGGRQFALAPEFSGIHSLFENGDLSLVSNVGPLVRPLTSDEFRAGTVQTPPRLFSHNDQQSVWQSFGAEGTAIGWGGRFGDLVQASLPSQPSAFTSISTLGNSVFLTGNDTRPYPITSEGGAEQTILREAEYGVAAPGGEDFLAELQEHFNSTNFTRSNYLEQDVALLQREGIAASARYNEAFQLAPTLSTTFPSSGLGNQLRSIAQSISIRATLGMSRQVFFATIGGFDTHSAQAATLPGLLSQINDALVAFNAAMRELGEHDNVTLFTASDFGRTLSVNGDGTDHGWGGNQLIMGGAVNGRHVYGEVPRYELGHSLDAGGGRLIPTTSVDQFADQLGQWFGLNEIERNIALPGLANFSTLNEPYFL